MPNWSQLSGVVERLITAALMYAVGRGWLLSSDVAPLAALGLAAISAGYAIVVNRNTNLAKQAASIPDTKVVTTPEIAAATPNQTNIVSSSDMKVVAK